MVGGMNTPGATGRHREMRAGALTGVPEGLFLQMVVIASSLALVAGYINAFAIMWIGRGLTHMTGNSASASIGIARSSTVLFGHSLNALCGFFFGSVFAGGIVRNQAFHVRRRYGLALGIESAILSVATAFLVSAGVSTTEKEASPFFWVAEFLIAFSSALQNGIFTMFSSAMLRTSHVTGLVVDMGIIVGNMLFHKDFRNTWKLRLFAPVYFSFVTGALCGAFATLHIQVYTLIPAICVLFLAFLVLVGLRIRYKLRKSRRLREDGGIAQIVAVGLFKSDSASDSTRPDSVVGEQSLQDDNDDDDDDDDDDDNNSNATNSRQPSGGSYVPPGDEMYAQLLSPPPPAHRS
eukprot:ANDGO_01753.mRNA.1 hypothetical protein H696_01075